MAAHTHKHAGFAPRSKLFLAVLAVSSASVVPVAQAANFTVGDVEGSFSSQLSVGASWRVEKQDPNLVSVGNGGSAPSTTGDDGNNNFNSGDTFSRIFKGNHDLELTYENYGAFFRGKYWYDMELKDGDQRHGHIANDYEANAPLDDGGFSDSAKFSGVQLLDAFVYGSFYLGDMPLDLRIGSQVVSWGESTFIRGGVNAINPVDVSAFRRPGAEIKEGLLPVPMIYGSLGLTDNLSVESFYQLEWRKTEIEGCGTYFSTVDWAADGCDRLAFAASAPDKTNLAIGAYGERLKDNEPDDMGQFGLAMRYYAEQLDTEFGVYYLNYHSRNPYVNAYRTSTPGYIPQDFGAAAPGSRNDITDTVASAEYQVVFPEDIQLFGLTAATNVGSWALSGEVSHRPDLPVQINGNDLLLAVLSDGLSPGSPLSPTVRATPHGGEIDGTRDVSMTQAQATAIAFFDQVLGASRIAYVGEVGATFVHDMDDDLRFGRNTIFGTAAVGDTDGFMTDFAWGYRLRTTFDYPSAFAGIDVKPVISFAHDVKGYSPSPGQQFNSGRQSMGLAVNFSYISKYGASLAYNRFSGGKYNEVKDRDFVSVSASYTF